MSEDLLQACGSAPQTARSKVKPSSLLVKVALWVARGERSKVKPLEELIWQEWDFFGWRGQAAIVSQVNE